jgi:hypothetical protein
VPDSDKNAVVTFHSTHQAMAAEDHLRSEGIDLEVIPPPAVLSAGCGLALKVRESDVPSIVAILKCKNIEFAGIFLMGDDKRPIKKLF